MRHDDRGVPGEGVGVKKKRAKQPSSRDIRQLTKLANLAGMPVIAINIRAHAVMARLAGKRKSKWITLVEMRMMRVKK